MGKVRASIDKSKSRKVAGLKRDNAKGPIGDEHGQEATVPAPEAAHDETSLTKEKLDKMFAESDPYRQLELFAGCSGMGHVEDMTFPTKIALEYDFLNVMFCKDQNFTAEQTIAFRDIAKSIFEAAVIRGELAGPTEAFQAFTERLLPFATMQPQTTQFCSTEAVGGSSLAAVGVIHEGDCSYTSPTSGGSHEPAVVKGLSEMSTANATTNPRVECNSKPSGVRGTPLFSVSDVAAISEFVSKGLYRYLALYRMCFTAQPAKVCREVRIVQVETPLPPPPLERAKPA